MCDIDWASVRVVKVPTVTTISVDELAQLRERIAEKTAWLINQDQQIDALEDARDKLQKRIAELEAEREKLRTACQSAERFVWNLYRESGKSPDDPARPIWQALRAALEETK